MPDDLRTIAARALELDAKRTPGEWDASGADVRVLNPTPFLAYKSVSGGRGATLKEAEANASFTAHAANHYAALARAYLVAVGELKGGQP